MSILARDVFEAVAPHVGDSGVCPENERDIIAYLNLVLPMLLKRLDSKGTIFQWCMPAHEGCFSIPHNCLEVRQIFLDGFPLVQRDQWYEGKLTVGLNAQGGVCFGRSCNANAMVRTCSMQNVFDMGDGFAIPTPWPGCWNSKIGFMAETDADAGKIVTLDVLNQYNDTIRFDAELPRNQQIVVVDSFVKDIQFLRKDQTVGNIVAFIIGPDGRKTRFCHYTPRTITASWHRKKLPPRQPCRHGMILIKGKARFEKLRDGNDVLLIDDLQALAEGCRAINAQRREDMQAYNSHLLLAVNELEKQLMDSESAQTVGQMQVVSPFGRALATKPFL